MNEKQEPKYKIVNGKIVNRQSGEAIPDDEPIMIFRARDLHAAVTMQDYHHRLKNGEHRKAVSKRILQFNLWAMHHPERMKEPDTDLPKE